ELDLDLEDEVAVGLLGSQEGVGPGPGLADDRVPIDAVGRPSADLLPAVERLAVEQGYEARFIAPGRGRDRDGEGPGHQAEGADAEKHTVHGAGLLGDDAGAAGDDSHQDTPRRPALHAAGGKKLNPDRACRPTAGPGSRGGRPRRGR